MIDAAINGVLQSLDPYSAYMSPELVKEMAVINDVEKVVDFTLDLLVGGDVDEATREILIEHLGGRYHYNYDESVKNGTLNGMFYLALTMPLYQLA